MDPATTTQRGIHCEIRLGDNYKYKGNLSSQSVHFEAQDETHTHTHTPIPHAHTQVINRRSDEDRSQELFRRRSSSHSY